MVGSFCCVHRVCEHDLLLVSQASEDLLIRVKSFVNGGTSDCVCVKEREKERARCPSPPPEPSRCVAKRKDCTQRVSHFLK